MMERLEKSVESDFGKKITEWAMAEGHNLAYVKFVGARGWPDRIVTWGRGEGYPSHLIWIEWKRLNEDPRPLQLYIHQQLREMGHDVRVYDDYRFALDEIKAEVESTLRADSRL